MMNISLFNSEADRNLWLKLMAEFGVEFQKRVNHNENCEVGSIDKRYSVMWVANEKLKDDEVAGKLRFTLEQLLTMSYEDYEAELRGRHKEWCKKFESL